MEIVYQHDLVMICYKREEKMLQVSWQSYLTTEDFVRGLRALLKLTAELDIEKWLVDARYSDELVIENMRWSKEYIGTALEQSRLKKVARISSGDEQHEQEIMKLVDYLFENYNVPCEIRFYDSKQEALEWLLEKTLDRSELTPEFLA
ncbi:STAS/SEC14 domain-containing protein [Adhaeribacter terreus]|uniref:STAS/SEC14 domain-containing protein n=1 Tax=Adhaeribacter terreus TaxID=529703 RepID=A0ABW0E9A5_9BACT